MNCGTSERPVGLTGIRLGIITSVPFFLVTQLRRQVIDLCERGASVVAITSRGDELSQVNWDERLRHVPMDIRRKPAPLADLRALAGMARLFTTDRFDIVHSTTPKAGLLTAVAGWIARVPVRLHTFTGQQWVTMSGPLRWVSRWSDRVIGWLNTRVYADSSSQRQFLINEGIVRSEKIGVIGAGSLAGVDVERFNPNRFGAQQRHQLRGELGIPEDSVVVTFIGRITRDKGINELMEAVSSLRSSGHKLDAVLIGPSDAALERKATATQGGDGPPDRARAGVHAVGYTDCPERYLAITDILCLPSYREGFGTVVIEAAAMGVPAVGTRITGLSDAIIEGETGLLVPPRDVQALAAALQRLIIDPILCRTLGDAARQRCLAQFDAEVVNEALAEEYLRLLSAVPARRARGTR